MREKVFISYKSEHRDIALRVRDLVRASDYPTWFDQDDIPKGAFFRDAIDEGLKSARVVIGILTQAALNSREVKFEWDYAVSGHSRLILLRYEAVELPYWLQSVQHIDCTSNESAGLAELQAVLNTIPATESSTPATHPAPEVKRATDNPPYVPQTDAAIKKDDDPIRAAILENVYQAWIEGVLRPNLPLGALELGIGLRPDAVLRHEDYGDYTLPDSSHDIAHIFHDTHGELLILGAPGAGKTILLLQLAEHLLGRAQHDRKTPLPLVFNLASWQDGQAFEEWLVTENCGAVMACQRKPPSDSSMRGA